MRICFGIFFIAYCCFGTSTSLAADNPEQQQTQDDLERVSSAISEIEDWLLSANQRLSAEQSELRDSELAYSQAREATESLQLEIESLESESNQLQDQQTELLASKHAQEEILGALLRSAYMSGDTQYLKLLLSGSELSEGSRMLQYARSLSEYQLGQIQQYELTIAEISSNETQLQDNLSRLESQLAELDQERQRLEALQTSKAAALASLQSSIEDRSAELEQLEINRTELETLLEEIARAMEGVRSFADLSPFDEQRGSLNPPVEGPFLSRFGESYGGGSLRRQGTMFGAAVGTPVQSIHGGQVVFANWFRGMGLLVVIDHGEGYMSLYGGNDALAVQAGDWIDARTVIATSGTGASDQAGVYLEIRLDGQAQNPENWLIR